MNKYILKLNTILVFWFILSFCVCKPPGDKPKSRMSSFDGRIFRNRRSKSVTLLEDVEEIDEMDNLPTEQDTNEFEEIPPDDVHENVGVEVREGIQERGLEGESFFRKLFRRMRRRRRVPVRQLSFRKIGERVEPSIDKVDEEGQEASEKKEDDEEEIANKRREMLAKIKSDIENPQSSKRLEKVETVEITVGKKEIPKPGTSSEYSKVIEELERMQFSRLKLEDELVEIDLND